MEHNTEARIRLRTHLDEQVTNVNSYKYWKLLELRELMVKMYENFLPEKNHISNDLR